MKSSPPLTFSFEDPDLYLRIAKSALPEVECVEAAALIRRGYPPVTSIESLSLLSGFSLRFVGSMVYQRTKYYRYFQIRKRHGYRQIQSPFVCLKVIQKWISHHLSSSITFPGCVQGFVPGRSIKSAALIHCPASAVLSFDLSDFFGSVDSERVRTVFEDLGYNRAVSHLLCDLCTLHGKLPQGSPASPLLANLAFRGTDVAVEALSDRNGWRYTRYADDISLSSRDTSGSIDSFRQAIEVVESQGWSIAPQKTRSYQYPAKPRVLGLLVDSDRPRLSRDYRRRVRAMRNNLEKHSSAISETKMKSISGHLAFCKMIEE